MIMGRYFDGDDNEIVQRMQESCYGDRLGELWRLARDRYLLTELTLGTKTELGALARQARRFDHRTLQYVHDLIAANFRRRYAERLQPDLPGLLSELPYEQRIAVEWIRYFAAECDALAEMYPTIAKTVLEATLYPSPDKQGIRAEEALVEMVKDR